MKEAFLYCFLVFIVSVFFSVSLLVKKSESKWRYMWKLCLGVSVIIEILLMCCNFKQ